MGCKIRVDALVVALRSQQAGGEYSRFALLLGTHASYADSAVSGYHTERPRIQPRGEREPDLRTRR